MNEKCVHIWDFDFQTFFCKVLGTKIYRVNVGHTNSHEWEEYTFVANSRKFFGKNTNKIVCYRNDNNNHNGNNDNKIEIRLPNYQIYFLLIVFEKS